jgi:hypothetical protein
LADPLAQRVARMSEAKSGTLYWMCNSPHAWAASGVEPGCRFAHPGYACFACWHVDAAGHGDDLARHPYFAICFSAVALAGQSASSPYNAHWLYGDPICTNLRMASGRDLMGGFAFVQPSMVLTFDHTDEPGQARPCPVAGRPRFFFLILPAAESCF